MVCRARAAPRPDISTVAELELDHEADRAIATAAWSPPMR